MYNNLLPQTLPVAGIQKETKRYIVQRGDRTYYVKQLPFQYDKEAPETLDCIIKLDEHNNEVLEIKQDYRPYLHAFYKIGQTYTFTIKADRMASGNYYEVNDELGFFSRIYHIHTLQPLKPGQKVRCIVRSIEGCALRLDFVEVQPEVEEFNLLRQELEAKAHELHIDDNDLIDLLLGITPNDNFEVLTDEWLLRCCNQCEKGASDDDCANAASDDECANAASNDDCANVQMSKCENKKYALNNENAPNEASSSFAHSHICTSAHSLSDASSAHSLSDAPSAHSQSAECTQSAENTLRALRRLCLFALEDSPMLRNLSPYDQQHIEKRLTTMVSHADTMAQALDITARDESQQLVENMLTKLKTSGNLYNAAERLLLLDFVLMLNPELFDQYVALFFDIITLDTNSRLRTERPYTTSFICILEHYIRHNRQQTDSVESMEGDEATQTLVNNLIKSLAMQQLLAEGLDKAPFDRNLNRASLYRFVTYCPGCDIPLCFNKAYGCLTADEQSPLEFTWKDVNNPYFIMRRVCDVTAMTSLPTTRHFLTDYIDLELGDTIRLAPAHKSLTCKDQLPYHLLPWHNIEVLSNYGVSHMQVQDKESLRPDEQLWLNLERHLFAPDDVMRNVLPANPLHRMNKRIPDVDDIVTIRIDRETDQPGVFHCVIEDDRFTGDGLIDSENYNIVPYRSHATLDCFRNDKGQQLLLQARIKEVDDDDTLHFEMRTPLNDALNEEFIYEYEEVFTAVITNYDQKRNTYACVSDYGLTFSFMATDLDEPLSNGTFVNLTLQDRKRGVGIHFARFAGINEDVKFDTPHALQNLMVWYAYGDDKVWMPSTMTQTSDEKDNDALDDADEMIGAPYVEELMRLTDRIAVVLDDYRQAYNYLGFTRLLALALADQTQADYYSKRMKLILMLKHFETNGVIEMIGEYENMGDNLNHYQGLSTQYRRLLCVSYLQQSEHNEELWQLVQSAKDPLLCKLAKLVLTYNLSGDFKLQQTQIALHKKIRELLNIKERETDLVNFGEEGQDVEFKTSIVYPANNQMREDVERQTWVILHTICGFLNSRSGGKLYLGVNNEGMGVGLQSDAQHRYFRGSNFHDSYERYIQDNVAFKVAKEVLSQLSFSWPKAAGRDVLCISIQPCDKLVKLDGQYWVRFGSETRELVGESARNYSVQRQAERQATTSSTSTPMAALIDNEVLTAIKTTAQPEDDAPIQPQPVAKPTLEKRSTLSAIHTTVQQHNDDAYAIAYINFIDHRTYSHTSDMYYGQARLTIPVYYGSENDFLVVVNTDGTMMRVPLQHILEQDERKPYSLFVSANVDILFAAVAKENDLLYTDRLDPKKNRVVSRCDTINQLAMCDSLNARGISPVMNSQAEIRQCAIISANVANNFKKITNLTEKQLGSDLLTKSYEKMRLALEHEGVTFN